MPTPNWKRLSWWIAGLALIAALAAPEITRTNSPLTLTQATVHEEPLNSR